MSTDGPTSADNDAVRGRNHWLYQFAPPLIMVSPLVWTSSGTSLVYLVGLLLLPVLISLVSIVVKLIRFRKKKYFLVRPLLTIVLFVLVLVIAGWTYRIARDQAIEEARIIHLQCNQESSCPKNPGGWQAQDSRIFRSDLGFWLKYTASYQYEEKGFVIRVYRGPDLGDIISGGIDLPFAVRPYLEDQ